MIRFHGTSSAEPQPRRWTREEYYKLGELGMFQDQRVELIEGEIFQKAWDREPPPRLWTRDEYYKMAEIGLFEGQRVQLIEGEILQMSPQGSSHAMTIGLVDRALREAFGEDFWIRVQLPIALSKGSEPEPDVAVVRGAPRDYPEHPSTTELVVEISESTLALDSTRKAALYARYGIQEYWIVDLVEDCLHVLRKPTADAGPYGAGYVETKTFLPGDTLSPLAAPEARIPVRDLLP